VSVDTTTETEQPVEETPEQQLAVATALKALEGKKLTFAEVMAIVGNPFEVSPIEATTEIHVPEITEGQRAALRKIALIYGVVQPTEPRLLSEEELSALMDERQTIDTILALLEPRKSNSIRETIAFHFDKLVESSPGFDADNAPERDASGRHYAVKQDCPAPGTGMEWQRIVQNNKPTLTSAAVERLWEDGLTCPACAERPDGEACGEHLTRKEYLDLTKAPEVKRVFDEEKARKAIKDKPALMFKLAKAAQPGSKTTVIKVGKDEG
jgi:hypothetical protein